MSSWGTDNSFVEVEELDAILVVVHSLPVGSRLYGGLPGAMPFKGWREEGVVRVNERGRGRTACQYQRKSGAPLFDVDLVLLADGLKREVGEGQTRNECRLYRYG
jgi:hypothetical protein